MHEREEKEKRKGKGSHLGEGFILASSFTPRLNSRLDSGAFFHSDWNHLCSVMNIKLQERLIY